MAIKYLRNSAAGAANGSSMANAYTTWVTAIAGLAAGDTLLVASDHTEASAVAINTTLPGTVFNWNHVVSVDPITENYSPGAFVSTTGDTNIIIGGYLTMEGVNFSCGVGATTARTFQFAQNATNVSQTWRDCTLTIPSPLNSRVLCGNGILILDNVSMNIANVNGYARIGGRTTWKNSTPYTGSAIPQFILDNSGGAVTFDGCDLTIFNGKTLKQTAAGSSSIITIRNCKMPAAFTPFSGQDTRLDLINVVNCSDTTGKVQRGEYSSLGFSTLSTSVYRSGGASDGVDSYSNRMLVASSGAGSGASKYTPFYSHEVSFYVAPADVGVAKTLTAYLLSTNAAGSAGVTLAANEAWLEIDYLGDSGSLDSAFTSSGPTDMKSNGTAPAADGSSTWTSTGLTSPVAQTVTKGFTPQKAGMHRARVAIGKANVQTFVDPKMILT